MKNQEKIDFVDDAFIIATSIAYTKKECDGIKKQINSLQEELEGNVLVKIDPFENNFRTIRGSKGDKGEKGDQGLIGPVGRRGPKGEKGDQGPQGPQGLQGFKGDIGPQGLPGKDGKNGVDGKTPDVEPFLEKISDHYKKLHSALVSNVNKVLMLVGGGGGGGGSVNLLDNDDVEFSQLSAVSNNSVLIFDSVKKKFVAKDLVAFINSIQTGVEVQYNKLIDVSGTYTYIGEALPGTSTSSATWRIKRVEQIGTDYNILWANGSSDFNKTWDSRLSYAYS